jgi:mannobiose 2-epimerase
LIKDEILNSKSELEKYLKEKLLPFWLDRCMDYKNGGFITHFDKNGEDTQVNEKSLISQTRVIYSFSLAQKYGYGNSKCGSFAAEGINFLIEKLWDKTYGGFYWMADREGNILDDKKILYGQSFAIYSLCEHFLATGDKRSLDYAEKTFDLVLKHCTDSFNGGYLEIMDRDWDLISSNVIGSDRKTFDVHMHLMESFTNIFKCKKDHLSRRKLLEIIDIIKYRMLHPDYGTGMSQFTFDWKLAPNVKLDIVWGMDRFEDNGTKNNPKNITSYGHNIEFAWLLCTALEELGIDLNKYSPLIKKIIDHTVKFGIDYKYGGIYVEGLHNGKVTDDQKEFWQQAEAMIGILYACDLFGYKTYWKVYKNIHNFIFSKAINYSTGEWWPLLTRKGEVLWHHMGNSWKINYHTIRSTILSIDLLNKLLLSVK